MSVYVLAVDGIVQKYPYTKTDLRFDNPTVSFPFDLTDELAAKFNVFPVVETTLPSYDAMTQNLIWFNPTLSHGDWIQNWGVVDASSDEIAQRLHDARQSMIVSPFQAKAALHNAGKLENIISYVNNQSTDPVVRLAYENATEWKRLSSMISDISSKLGLTDAEVDSLFLAAAQISV
jgi:hypothetical protein